MRVPTPQTLYFALTHLLPSNWTGPQACNAASSLQITLRTCALGFPSGVSWVAGNYVTCMYLGEWRMWVWSGMKTLSRVVQSLRNLCRPPPPQPGDSAVLVPGASSSIQDYAGVPGQVWAWQEDSFISRPKSRKTGTAGGRLEGRGHQSIREG